MGPAFSPSLLAVTISFQSSRGVLPAWLCPDLSPFYKDTDVLDQAHPNDLILIRSPAKTLFPNEVTFPGTGVRTSNLSWETPFNPWPLCLPAVDRASAERGHSPSLGIWRQAGARHIFVRLPWRSFTYRQMDEQMLSRVNLYPSTSIGPC